MLAIHLKLDGDGAYPDLRDASDRIIHLGNDTSLGVSALSGGMTSGKPSVMLRIDLPDGRVVLAETSMALFLATADALRARYGHEL